jgi:2-polyprenyl-3-methyl-5-hydroxy-6-metoxy-1,4-benzoquinol methylase
MKAEESPYLFKQDRYSSHAQIASRIRYWADSASVQQSFTVLDVGCASGFLRPFLPSPYFHLVGVEYDPALVVQARQHYDAVYQADLTTDFELPIHSPPQAIVLADILEHLPNPEVVLTKLLRQYAKPGTPVTISLPNVAHLYVRLSLLLGRFDYSDRGILDRTHLRFYTLKTASQLCRDCAIQVQSIRVTPIPLPLVHPLFGEGQTLFPLHRFNAFLASTCKGLLGYQFIFDGTYEP